jgi:TonB-linked SusC/RagA family outer membrane protein
MKNYTYLRKSGSQKYLVLPMILLSLFFLSAQVIAQESQIKGKVVAASDNTSLPGVSIVIKGTTQGTVTNADGDYQISAPSDGILTYSFIGMETQEIEISGRNVINISMLDETTGLDEVVVVGYGVQKKVNLSGAVDAVDTKELESRPITNLSQGLQGLVPNLNIDFVSGEPGQAAQINIRGITSINGGEPLILIDGVPADTWELNRLTPEDVSDISVLKDASSAAIYGARAAFGVILITTKSGTKEGLYVSYNNNMSWSKPTLLPNKISDPYIYMRLLETSTDNTPWDNINYSDDSYAWAKDRSNNPSGTEGVRINPNDPTSWEYMGNRDWTYYFLDDYTFSQKHHLQLDGKTDKTRYYLSGSYDNENGALKIADDLFKRYSVRSKIDFTPFKWLTIGNNTLFTMTERKEPSYLDIWELYNLAPTSYDKNPDGSWANTGVGQEAARLLDGGEVDNSYNSTQSTFTVEGRFFDGALKVNSDFTIRKGNSNYGYYYSKYKIGYGPEDIREIGSNSAYRSARFDTYNVFNIYSTFSKTFNKHQVTALVGFNQENNRSEWFKAQRDGVISGSLPTIALANGEDYVGEEITDWAIRGTFFRLNYIFNDRYIIEFNGRYDGTSRFPSETRFGFFPSASAAWRIDRENFMRPIEHIVSTFKLRASYGSLGNQNVYDDNGNPVYYGYIPTMDPSEAEYIVDGELPQRVSPPQLVSDNYSWETVSTVNFGADIGLFKDKLVAAFDIYQRNTTDMLTLGRDLPDVLGADEPKENAADLQTNGFELTLSYKTNFVLSGKRFNFNTRFILSDSRTWITSFDNPNKNLSQYYKGQEFGEIWGLESDGFYQTVEETQALDETQLIPWGALSIVPGWPKYIDQDGNGIIEKGYTVDDAKDAKIIGNTSPRFRFGLNLNFEWNNFDVRTFVQGVGKKDYYPRHYLYWGFYQQPYAGGYEHLTDFYRATDESDVNMAKHSQSYIDAGLANANLDSKYPVLQSWLADRNLGEDLNNSKGLATPQTKYLLNASYIRIKNITVGYTLPRALTNKVSIERVRFFVSGENIAEWSEVSDYFDPEAVTDN